MPHRAIGQVKPRVPPCLQDVGPEWEFWGVCSPGAAVRKGPCPGTPSWPWPAGPGQEWLRPRDTGPAGSLPFSAAMRAGALDTGPGLSVSLCWADAESTFSPQGPGDLGPVSCDPAPSPQGSTALLTASLTGLCPAPPPGSLRQSLAFPTFQGEALLSVALKGRGSLQEMSQEMQGFLGHSRSALVLEPGWPCSGSGSSGQCT